ncbi:Protein ELYS [Wickerhamiella sorbophila]|uniref:Protein ELYS n=1 Tax=Wickerhamiella sorbophila TaxID=45607 RepID=A0A2T0FBZ4_9ASCO|nr:Protein ELYS [Wickerhamiella sorbophila]PRT52487.1 Protein ELYS [Wickerhamiella sorbophila]
MSFAQALVKTLSPDPYGESGIEKIIARRRSKGLGVDILLGPNDAPKYPPRGTEERVQLIQKIESNLPSRASQTRAIYYLLLDYPVEATNNESVAAYFSSEIKPSHVQTRFVQGLWHLDHNELEQALACLCEPWEAEVANSSDFYAFIMSALAPEPRLLTAFIDAKQPPLDTEAMNVYVDALASQGLTFEILQLSRTHRTSEPLKQLGQFASNTSNRQAALSVAQLPCDADEWLIVQNELDKAIEKDADGLAGELTMVRAIHTGDLPTISRMKRLTDKYALIAKGTAEL